MPLIARIEGFAIVSEDGMLADAAGVMPAALQAPADQRFFEAGLGGQAWSWAPFARAAAALGRAAAADRHP